MTKTEKEEKVTPPENLTKGKIVEAVKKASNVEPLIVQNGTSNDRDKIIYLYQYVLNSKTGIIRNELYEYFILRVLYDHAKEVSLTKEEIVKNIENDFNLVNIPSVHITSALSRLQSKKAIIGKERFSLLPDKIVEMKQNNQNFIQFMNKVLLDLENKIEDEVQDLPEGLAKTTVKNFVRLLGRVFTVHGKFAARIIANKKGSLDTLKNYDGFRSDYNRIVLNFIPEQLQSQIDEIFNEFLFDPTEEQSKFFYAMAQSHTLLEVLNVDPDLKQVQESTLKQIKLFLDTNIVIYLLFEESRQCESIKAIIENSRQAGISLYVNKITKKEFDNWLDSKKGEVKSIRTIPAKLSEALFSKKLDAPLFTSYTNSLNKNPHQTVDQFCLKFEDITKILSNKYDIQLDDEKIEIYKENENYDGLREAISAKSMIKSPNVVTHDALCILKVKEYRKNNPSCELGPKAWFLTTDSSLWKAEKNIFDEDEIRASITSTLWSQILSPIISPKLGTPNTAIGFTKLLSMNFGADSIIDQEDIMNITTAFIDDKDLTTEDLKEIIGDKHVRETLKKVHEAHLKNDLKEEQRWTSISMSTVTNKLKGKHTQEVEGLKHSISEFTKRLDDNTSVMSKQNERIEEQQKQIEQLTREKQEKNWKNHFMIAIIVAIGLSIIIPIMLYVAGYVTKTNDILVLGGIESASILAIFVPWRIHRKSSTKK